MKHTTSWEGGPAEGRMASLLTQLKTPVRGGDGTQQQEGQRRIRVRPQKARGEERCPWLSGETWGPA